MKIRENISLKNYTTFKIGGPARFFKRVKTKKELEEALRWAKKKNVPVFILGGGSNLLVSDEGYPGLVVKMDLKDVKIEDESLMAGAGLELKKAVFLSLKHGLSGLQWAAGIPGTVGGAVRGNAAAFKEAVSDSLEKVEALNTETLEMETFRRGEFLFANKESVFKKKPHLVIVKVVFRLKPGEKKRSTEEIKKHLAYRRENHPLDRPSSGCIFKNVEKRIKDPLLLKKFPELESFNERGVIPAGYLIDKAGLKGEERGGARVSKKHANFIINTGGASAKEVCAVIELVKSRVEEVFGVKLEEEIKYVGFKNK